MAATKGAQRSATVAHCPVAPLMGLGTMAGAIDMSFMAKFRVAPA